MHTVRIIGFIIGIFAAFTVQAAQSLVAIHDSELTRALETKPAAATTPHGASTTGFEWWPLQWHYFVMPESVREALRSDGTPFTTVTDADITSGALLDRFGLPKYPIVISLATEAIRDDEIQPLLDYVAAGGTLFVGSSSFTRKTDGVTRGDFAIANEMGIHMVNANLSNWASNYSISKQIEHRLVTHIPSGVLTWKMPWSSEETSWGLSPNHTSSGPHPVWKVQAGDAQVLAKNDVGPYLLVKDYGKGRFIYHAGMQPLIGHGGWAPSMYTYGIFREAIQWAFESQGMPVPHISPWPYPYDAALNVRHDFENFQSAINGIEASAQYENSVGAKGDYYLCTGTLRVDMGNSTATIASLRRAVTNYGATIAPHNGGLRNPSDLTLTNADYDYWHWGLDESLDVTPSGFASGKDYALTSLGNAFQDIEGWLSGLTNAKGLRIWVSPYFNSTREDSFDILGQLGVAVAGEQKLTPYPHWTLSTRTSGKRYSFVSLPVSDWYVGPQIAQSLEYHASDTMHAAVDYYYSLGALINLYSHGVSNSGIQQDYITYSLAKPRIWSTNAAEVYSWWWKRGGAQIVPTISTSGNQTVVTLSITGSTDPQTAVDVWIPQAIFSGLLVKRNGTVASTAQYRTDGQRIRVLVGTTINTVEIRYTPQVSAADDAYTTEPGHALTVPAPGVLTNDTGAQGNTLSAILMSGPSNGTLDINANGGFTYTPAVGFSGTDYFFYRTNDRQTNSAIATVAITVKSPVTVLFSTDFATNTVAPWVSSSGTWSATSGVLHGTSAIQNYAYAYYNATWTDYAVQGRIQFPSGGYGGGLGGRVNLATGAHYGAWICPDGSSAGSLLLTLVKFRSWTTWSGIPMQQVSLPSVGNAWHTLKLTFQGSRILVAYDGVQMIDVTDNGFDSRAAYSSGGITADMWTDRTAYNMNIDDVSVTSLSTANQPPVAVNDSYSMVSGTPLAVASPGVLSNDTDANGNSLSAILLASSTNGTLSLNANGGFTYTPTVGFSGTDRFTYCANDGQANSGTATATIIVTAPVNQPPTIALVSPSTGSIFTSPANIILSATATDTDGSIARVVFYSGTSILTEVTTIPYTFAWNNVVSGSYNITARAYDNHGASTTSAITNITVNPASGILYSNDFSQNTLAPWIASSGTWNVAGGVMHGNSTIQSFGYTHYNATWADYAVQGSVQFPAGGFGGGLGGRLDASTGAHYGAWICPAGSFGSSAVLILAKFRTWTTWSGTPMQQVNLPTIGTGWHTLKLTFQGARILVSYDGTQMIDVTDNGFDERAAYLSGGITADMWTDSTAYTMNVDNVSVTSLTPPNQPPVAANDTYSMVSGTTLTITSTGVLSNDTDTDGNGLSTILITSPTNGTLSLNSNGGFTYTPVAGFSGTDRFTYCANDGQANSSTATVAITVTPATVVLYSSDFSTNTISPWIVSTGTWTATSGAMHGTSSIGNYGYAYNSAIWTDYALQGRIQFPTGAFGGGLGGRLNPATGEHYGVWIYPEGSSGGSSIMSLVKFRSWSSWSGTPMQQVSLPSVGNTWHTLKITFQGSRILAAYDGVQMIDVTDNGFDSRAAYSSGGITTDMWTDRTAYTMNVDDITVTTGN